jgi:hemoglobin
MMHKMFLLIFTCMTLACSPTLKKFQPSLYQQLGELEGIEALVHDMIVNFSQDKRIVERFYDVNITRFKTGSVNYVCSVSGGPCEYTGDSMQLVHAGHGYTDTEFNAVVENLIEAMNKGELPIAVQNQLLALLAPSYKDIVYQ